MREIREVHVNYSHSQVRFKRLLRRALQLALFVGLLGLSYNPVFAATLTVTSAADSGAGTLRDTIASASNGDEIVFDASLNGGTITLASVIDIATNVTINGNSQITLSGGNSNQIFDIDNGTTVTIDGITFVNGRHATLHGGAITNSGNLTITNSMFSGNNAGQNGGAIFSDGTVTVSDSNFISNTAGARGGAIDNNGTFTLTNAQISSNNATNGGGIGNSGTFTVEKAQFVNNTAFTGGGIANSENFSVTDSTFSENTADNGGAIYNSGEMTVENSTIVGNRALDGAGASNTNVLSLNNTTLSANIATNLGGAVYNSVTLNLRNSTLTLNEATSGAGIYSISNSTFSTHTLIVNQNSGDDCVGDVTSNRYNIDSDGTCSFTSTGDQSDQDIELGELADNGGETQTHQIPPGSVAHNTGNTSCQSTDQRGTARAQDTNCDIGAHELIVPTMAILGNGVPLTTGDTTPDVSDFTDFGNVPIGTPKTTNFEITNTGEADLVITAIDSTDPHFEGLDLPIVIPGNSTVVLPIRFSPNELEELTSTITITHNDPNQPPFVFAVVATGVPPIDGSSIGGVSNGPGTYVEGSYWTTPENGCWQGEFLSGCVYLNLQRVDHATGGNHYLDAAEVTVRDNRVCLNVPAGYQISGYTLNQDPKEFFFGSNCFQFDPAIHFNVYRIDFAIIPNVGSEETPNSGTGFFVAGNGGAGSDADRGAFFAQGAAANPTAVPPTATLLPTAEPTPDPTEVISATATANAVAQIQAQATADADPTRVAALAQQAEVSSASTARAEALVIQTPVYSEEAAARITRVRLYFWQEITLYVLIGGSVIALGLLGGMAAQSMVYNREEDE